MYARIRGLFRFSDLDDITDYPIDLVAYILTVKKKKKFSMNRTELNIVSCSRLVVPLRALCGIHFRSLKLLVCADNPTVCCQFFFYLLLPVEVTATITKYGHSKNAQSPATCVLLVRSLHGNTTVHYCSLISILFYFVIS